MYKSRKMYKENVQTKVVPRALIHLTTFVLRPFPNTVLFRISTFRSQNQQQQQQSIDCIGGPLIYLACPTSR